MNNSVKNEYNDFVMETRNITQVYPGTVALKNVDYKLYRGKVNVLIGQNGAGKSTLMRILAGIEQPTQGEIFMNGKKIELHGPREAEAMGISIIHQELNLFPLLSVAQNIFMGQENSKFLGLYINKKTNNDKAGKILRKLEHFIDPNTRVSELKMGQQQIIEIAKTMVKENMQVLIMDEPTSSLSKAEVEILFKLIGELKQQGITIVYISHRMEEILRVGDYVTAIRDGVKVAEDWIKNIDLSWMVKAMVGRTQESMRVEKTKSIMGEEVLRVEHLTLPSETGVNTLEDISFSLKRGEILGIYGLLGSGRTELFECLMGMRPESSSEIFISGKKIKVEKIKQQIKKGFFMVPEDRKDVGLIHTLSVGKNLTISCLEKFAKFGQLNTRKEYAAADNAINQLSIKVSDKGLPIYSLSGGNQQKVVIGKGIMTDPRILLLDEPTRGIDVGAKEEVFKLVYDIASQGCGVILVASELSEVMRISDRVIVFSGGKIAGELKVEEFNEEALVKASEKNLKVREIS
jgi:erythritol transport system ATP-binding protein